MKENVRVGVIGAGRMGFHHARSLAEHIGGAQLAAVADLDDGAAERAAALATGAAVIRDHRSLLADGTIDAVVIATPNSTHAQLVKDAAEAGKHIFCEKPLALDLESADVALAAVGKSRVKLQVGFQRRFDPGFRRARDLVRDGAIGAVELLVCTTRDPSPPSVESLRTSGGLYLDTLIHDLDAVRFLADVEAVQVYSTASRLCLPVNQEGFVDTATTVVRLETGALAVITNSLRASYGYEVGAEVLGQTGKVTVAQEQHIGVRRFKEEGVWHDHVYWVVDRFRDAFLEEMRHFVECVRLDRQPEVSGAEARAALSLALAAAQSSREGRPLAIDKG